MNPIIISPDELKKTFEGYNPEKAEEFHESSAKMADKAFEQELKKLEGDEVVLLSGGGASGKTEFLSLYLADFEGIVFDGTLPTFEGAKIKIRKVQKMGKKAVVCAIIPDDLKRAMLAFLNRERKYSVKHFYRTHSSSRKTILEIAKAFPEVEIRVYQSIYTHKGNLLFGKISFNTREELTSFLEDNQLSQEEITHLINK